MISHTVKTCKRFSKIKFISAISEKLFSNKCQINQINYLNSKMPVPESNIETSSVMSTVPQSAQSHTVTGNLSEWAYTNPRQILFLILNSLSVLAVLLM